MVSEIEQAFNRKSESDLEDNLEEINASIQKAMERAKNSSDPAKALYALSQKLTDYIRKVYQQADELGKSGKLEKEVLVLASSGRFSLLPNLIGSPISMSLAASRYKVLIESREDQIKAINTWMKEKASPISWT